ncbi:unnamed protein product, partial [Gulo gulo]
MASCFQEEIPSCLSSVLLPSKQPASPQSCPCWHGAPPWNDPIFSVGIAPGRTPDTSTMNCLRPTRRTDARVWLL